MLETYFLDEARTMPTAHWSAAVESVGYLGHAIKRLVGTGVTAGWALTVQCPAGDSLTSYLAIELMKERTQHGRWVMVVVPDEGETDAALWSYMQSAMSWEVGIVGAVVNGYVKDIDEIKMKLEKEFGVFGLGGSPMPSMKTAYGTIGAPVVLNSVTIRPGDLILADKDGVIAIPKDIIERAFEVARDQIVHECNQLALVREGKGPVDILGLEELLKGEVEKGE
ncbi:MAG TPA: RraA family protein [Firmicutes bacterium]|nr:RraA family protein [Bacillota bacterium]